MGWWIAVSSLAVLSGLLTWRLVTIRKVTRRITASLDGLNERNVQLDRALRSFRNTYAAERRTFSKDIHDDLGGSLSALKLMLNGLGRNRYGEDYDTIVAMKNHIDEMVASIRRIVLHLQPMVLDAHGLAEATREFCNRKNEMKLASVTFRQEGEVLRLQPDVEFVLYRSVQELVNNAMQHSGAWHIEVLFCWTSSGLSISVKDDGVGYYKSKPVGQGTGLLNLKSQVYSVGGKLDLMSGKKGFTGQITFPITAQSLVFDARP